jgi:hypothetical protein
MPITARGKTYVYPFRSAQAHHPRRCRRFHRDARHPSLLTASQKWLPNTVPPLRQDPGEFMAKTGKEALPDSVHRRIPQVVEMGAARTLAVGYGLTFGGLYTLLRPQGGSPFVDGVILGIANWATGYLGWLPALGLMPPVWQQNAPQAITPIAEHALYGIITVAMYDWLRERVPDPTRPSRKLGRLCRVIAR